MHRNDGKPGCFCVKRYRMFNSTGEQGVSGC